VLLYNTIQSSLFAPKTEKIQKNLKIKTVQKGGLIAYSNLYQTTFGWKKVITRADKSTIKNGGQPDPPTFLPSYS
jgi:hypothetical protein